MDVMSNDFASWNASSDEGPWNNVHALRRRGDHVENKRLRAWMGSSGDDPPSKPLYQTASNVIHNGAQQSEEENGTRCRDGILSPESATRLHAPFCNRASTKVFVYSAHQSHVTVVAWSPDSSSFATGASDTRVILWDAGTGLSICTLRGQSRLVRCLAWSPSGAMLASVSCNGTVVTWDVNSGEIVHNFRGDVPVLQGVAWSPDGVYLSNVSTRGSCYMRDVATGVTSCKLRAECWPKVVAWSPDMLRVASCWHKQVRLWDVTTGMNILNLKGHQMDQVMSVAWSPNGHVISAGTRDNRVLLWDVTTGEVLRSLQGHKCAVMTLAWSPDSSMIAGGASDGRVMLWDIDSGVCRHTLTAHECIVYSIAWSPDGTMLISHSMHEDVVMWDVKCGRVLYTTSPRVRLLKQRVWCPSESSSGVW